MDEQARESAFMSALVTEHFVLQSAASTTVSEANGRAALYLSTLSSSLVAMGFAAQSAEVFVPFAASVIPAVLLMGVFTVVRLVDTGVQNLRFQTGIARIRSYYHSLTPEAAEFFAASDDTAANQALAVTTARTGRRVGLLTIAAMIAVVNSLVAGAAAALLFVWAFGRDHTAVAVGVGVVVALLCMAVFLAYQNHRYVSGVHRTELAHPVSTAH